MLAPITQFVERIDYGYSAPARKEGEGPRYLRITDIVNGSINWEKVPSCEISQKAELAYRLEPGDILVARTGGTVGKSVRIQDAPRSVFASYLLRLRPKKSVNPEFLSLFLESPAYWHQLESFVRGGAQPNVSATTLKKLQVPAISLNQQNELVSKLSSRLHQAKAAVGACNTQNDDALLLQMRLISGAFFEECPLGLHSNKLILASNWKWQLLTRVARLESGHTPSRRRPEWWGGDVPWLALPDIRRLHGKHVYITTENTNNAGLTNSSARLLPAGTVCLSRTASVGYVTILGKPMATSQDFANWICDADTLDPEFLMYAFMASQDYLRELGSGAVHKTIYMPAIESFHVCAPEIDEQRRIARTLGERLAAVEPLTTGLKTRLAEIERLPQRLLAYAFGQL